MPEAELGGRTSSARFIGIKSLLIFALLRDPQLESLLVLPVDSADLAEAWLFLLDHATTAAIPTLPNWTAGISMKSVHV